MLSPGSVLPNQLSKSQLRGLYSAHGSSVGMWTWLIALISSDFEVDVSFGRQHPARTEDVGRQSTVYSTIEVQVPL